MIGDVYSRHSGIYHYRSMAKTNYRTYLREGMVPLKKYFYVLRPLLSVRWLERYQTPAPIDFQKLLHLLDDAPELLTAIDELLIKKQAAPEMGLAPQVPILNQFIETELGRLESAHIEHIAGPNVIDSLNALLHETVHRR
ncbi:nucleotidyltransferase domain-containing protein [Oxalobacteraceae bacterium OTU3CAMAD1]|nr:nucleotidyltransferase domain-containing protein [Oxalobacteraceae bacterium OTU3CAMAD1]